MERTYSHIDLEERRKIARWRTAGLSVEVIAEKLGRDQRGGRIAALHNKCFPIGQKSGIVHEVDAHDGRLPVPSQQLFPSEVLDLHTSWAAVSAGPFFFFVRVVRRSRGGYAKATFARGSPLGNRCGV